MTNKLKSKCENCNEIFERVSGEDMFFCCRECAEEMFSCKHCGFHYELETSDSMFEAKSYCSDSCEERAEEGEEW